MAVIGAACVCAAAIVWRLGFFSTSAAPIKKGIPVQVLRASRRDSTPYLSSIATVQAFNAVLVRARTDGQITRIAFEEGTEVKRGDVLVELDRRPFEAQWRAANAQKARDSAQLENAKQDLSRYQTLVDTDSGAVQTRDTTRAQVAQLAAAVAADQAQIDLARLQLTYATIVAPIDGRTGARLVDVGNIVHANDAAGLVMLMQIHPIALGFSLPQNMLATVREQQGRHRLRVVGMDPAGTRLLDEGQMTLIDNQIESATGTFRCKAVFPNATEALWPGQFVTARVLLEPQPDAVVVPSAAVQIGQNGLYVYLVSDKKRAEIRSVQTGQTRDGETVILRGLAGGEQVVTEGQFQLEPGAAVETHIGTSAASPR